MTDDLPAPAPPKLDRSAWGLILILAAINFTHFVDFVILMPLGGRIMRELAISPGQFSRVVSAYGIAAFFASVLAAAFADRFDRKRLILVVYTGFVISTLFCGLAPNYELLLVARVMAGIYGGLASAAIMAVIADAFPPARRGTATGAVMSAFAVASIAGLPLGLALADEFGRGAPFIAVAAVGAFVWIAVLVWMPAFRAHLTGPAKDPLAEFALIVQDPNHIRAFAWTFTLVCGTFTIIPFLGPFITRNVGRPESDLKIIYLVAGLFTLVSMNVIGWLTDRLGRRPVFLATAAGALVMILVITNMGEVPLAVAALAAAGFMVTASGRMVPAQAMMLGAANPQTRGGFTSLNAAVQNAATGIAPQFGGLLLADTGPNDPLIGYPLVGLVAAGFAILSMGMVFVVRPSNAPATPIPIMEPEPVAI